MVSHSDTLTADDPTPSLSGEYMCTAVEQEISGSHQLTIVPGIYREISKLPSHMSKIVLLEFKVSLELRVMSGLK